MFIGSDNDTDGKLIGLWVLATATVLYVLTLLRVLNPFKRSLFAMGFGIGMLVFTLLLLVWGVAGPTMSSITRRDDRRIEQHLRAVESAIDQYAQENKKLPDNLSQLTFNSSRENGAKELVDDGLVRYKNEGLAPEPDPAAPSYRRISLIKKYRYQLCVTYKQVSSKSRRDYADYSYTIDGSGGYSSSLSTYSHPAGEVCYKLQKTIYDNSTIENDSDLLDSDIEDSSVKSEGTASGSQLSTQQALLHFSR
jgi:type II secretory pathway pseudopilin PulG